MNIDLHNYETFFLLYMDNELSVAERKAVEEFVENNEELREEFLQLKDAVLPIEEISFPVKKELYKSQVIETAMQERLLTHLDGELEGKAREEIDGLLLTNAAIQKEWNVLQQTRLEPEPIVFPYKSSLYRRSGKAVIARIARLAIAAAIIGFGIFLGVRLQDDSKVTTPEIARTQPKQEESKKPAAKIVTPDDPAKNEEVILAATEPRIQESKMAADRPNHKTTVPENEAEPANTLVASTREQVVVEQVEVEIVSPEPASVQVRESSQVSEPIIDRDITPVSDKLAMTASLNDNEVASDDRILFIKQENITRSKAAAFFRKVKRVVERNTKIKTGDNLSIGGFEIAIK